jgi:hypothetical protein
MAKRKGAKGKIRVITQLPNSEQSYKGKEIFQLQNGEHNTGPNENLQFI